MASVTETVNKAMENTVDRVATDFETAVALSGQGPSTHDVTLRVRPTIDTSLGPIQYPEPISIRLASAGDSR